MIENELQQSGSAVLISMQQSNRLAVPPARGSVSQGTKPLRDFPEAEQPAILEEVLIEEVSIDGMCGVY